MSSTKMPMSTSYKAVFVLSIVMIFLVFIGGAMSGSKSVGFGVWYWGYTAWKMYKRNNDALVSLQKVMLWFEALAFTVALAVLLFSDSDVRRYVDVTPLELILLASLSMGVTFALYKYFGKQVKNPNVADASSNDEDLWSTVSDELKNGQRVDSLWTRAFAESDGDSNKANARYIKMRVEQLRDEFNTRNESAEVDSNSTLKLPAPNKKPIGTGVILIGVAIVAYTALYFLKDYNNSVGQLTPLKSQSTEKISIQENSSDNSKPIKSLDEVRQLCYVYWDGVRWRLGKTEGDKFIRFSREFYGVEMVHLSVPVQVAKELNAIAKPGESVSDFKFKNFMDTNWYQVETLCKFK